MNKLSAPYWWVNDESRSMLERGYMTEGQTVEDKVKLKCKYAASFYKDHEGLEEKFENMISRGWCSLSSPIWANFGEGRGLPISCFGSYVTDSLESIYEKLHEVAVMSQMGGGTSGYFGNLRPKDSPIKGGGKSSGTMSFISLYDQTAKVVTQSGVRRGAFAAYLPITHPEITEFLKVKDKGNDLQTVFTAVNIEDTWMQDMLDGDKEKREIWARVLKSRREKGIPYLFFTDTVNKNKPQIYKDTNSNIVSSNLCNEIMLSSNSNESFVCCLMSMNLALYDEWKDTDAPELAVMFLDAVMEDFIRKTKSMKSMEAAHNFAKRQRALGVGVLGWHSLLQKKRIPFESQEAQWLNTSIFRKLRNDLFNASVKLGEQYGYAPIFDEVETLDTKRRNVTLMAVAPTTSSSSILGQVSPGIEPFASNYFVAGLAKGSFPRKNPELEKILEEHGKNNTGTWKSISENKGSVKHLDFLSDEEKEVFKTFEEISPLAIIQQAAARQPFIDQSQSLNLKIPLAMSIKDVNKIHIEAWQSGLKGLYYMRTTSIAKEAVLEMMNCRSCEG